MNVHSLTKMQAKRINFIDILCPPSLRLSSKPPKVICMLEPGAKGFECRSYSGAVTAEHLFTTSSPMIPGEKKKKKKKTYLHPHPAPVSPFHAPDGPEFCRISFFRFSLAIYDLIFVEPKSPALGARTEIGLRVSPHPSQAPNQVL